MSERLRRLRWVPALSLGAALAHASMPAAWSALSEAWKFRTLPAEERSLARVGGLLPLIRRVESRVSPREAVLFDVRQVVQPLYTERVLDYWLYPRKVYSAEALRLRGADRSDFLAARGVSWVCAPPELSFVGAGARAEEEAPPFPRSAHPARAGAGILLALAHFLVVGYGLLLATGAAPLLGSRVETAALSFLLGMGVVATLSVLSFVLGHGVSLVPVLLPLAPALAVIAGSRARRARSAGSGAGAPTARTRRDAATVLAAALVLVLVLRAVATPMEGYDDRYQWAHKAHILLEEKSVRGEGFQDPYGVHFHPRYPLLVPGAEAAVFLFAGAFDDQYVKVLFPLSWAAALVVLFQCLRLFAGGPGRGAALLLLVLVPYYWGYERGGDHGAAFQAYPDLILSAFATSALAFFLRGLAAPGVRLHAVSALLLLFAGLTKSEGGVHVLLLLALAAFWLPRRAGRPRLAFLRSFAPYAGAALLVGLYEVAVVRRTQPGFLPDDYSVLFTPDRLAAGAGRGGAALADYARDVFLSRRFAFFGLVLLVAAAVGRRRLSRPEVAAPAVYAALLTMAFFLPYLVLPEEEWRRVYRWSAGRLLSQVLPVAFLAASLLLLPGTEDGRTRAGPPPDSEKRG